MGPVIFFANYLDEAQAIAEELTEWDGVNHIAIQYKGEKLIVDTVNANTLTLVQAAVRLLTKVHGNEQWLSDEKAINATLEKVCNALEQDEPPAPQTAVLRSG